MIDFDLERRKRAFDRLRDSVEAARSSMIASFDQMLEAIDVLASTLAQPAPANDRTAVPQLVNVERAAEILAVNKATLDSFVRHGHLKYVALPSGRGERDIKRFSIADLEAFQKTCSRVAS